MMNLPAEVMLMICHARPALTQADRRGKPIRLCIPYPEYCSKHPEDKQHEYG